MTLLAVQVRKTLETALELRLLQDGETRYVMTAFAPDSPFAPAVGLADTMHVHVKVDAVHALPHPELRAAGGTVENEKDGYIKYAFPSGMNLIFSSIAVSHDDLRAGTKVVRHGLTGDLQDVPEEIRFPPKVHDRVHSRRSEGDPYGPLSGRHQPAVRDDDAYLHPTAEPHLLDESCSRLQGVAGVEHDLTMLDVRFVDSGVRRQ